MEPLDAGRTVDRRAQLQRLVREAAAAERDSSRHMQDPEREVVVVAVVPQR